MTPPDDKTQKRLIVDQVLAPNSSTSAEEQMRLVAEMSIFKNKYEFLGVLGSGGMGVVYKARETMLDRLVAIKMLNAVGFSVQDLRRFQQEAKAATKLVHPNLPAIRDFGVTAEGQPYMAFDFIEGQTLAQIIKKRGQLEIENALDLFIQALRGLSYAHQRGVLHRDIKPGNIIISEGNREVRIVDFGIAKVIDEETTQRLTQTGEVFGTPLYMSPEQGAGKRLDERSDLYSMGCVIFEALTAVPPLVGESAIYTIIKHQNEDPPSLKEASLGKDFPLSLEKTVAKLLAKNPDDRYQTAKELMDDLIEIKASLGVAPTKPAPAVRAPTARPNVKIEPILIAVISIALVVALGNMARMALQSQSAAPPELSGIVLPTTEFDKMVTGLDLSGQRITHQLMKQLYQYPNLKVLNLHGAVLVDQPLSDLRVGIAGMNLASSKTDEEGQTVDNSSFLDLSASSLNDADMKVLPNPDTLPDELNLDNTRISDAGLRYLGSSNVQNLSLRSDKITDAGLFNLKDLDNLTTLRLTGDAISDAGLRRMSHFPRLMELDLQAVKGPLTARGISQLTKCHLLSKLSISDEKLIGAISDLHQIRELSIYSNTVSDDDLLQLKALPDLAVLTIYGGAHDLERLRSGLHGCEVQTMHRKNPGEHMKLLKSIFGK